MIVIIQHLFKSLILFQVLIWSIEKEEADRRKVYIYQIPLLGLYLLTNTIKLYQENKMILAIIDVVDMVIVLGILMLIVRKLVKKSYLFSLTMAMIAYALYSMYLILISLSVYPICALLGIVDYIYYATTVIFLITIVLMYIFNSKSKGTIGKLFEKRLSQYFVICSGVLVLFITRGIVVISDYVQMNIVSAMFYIIVCMCLVMLMLWIADKTVQTRETEAILDDNQKLSSGLHRQKELLPSIGYQLSSLIEELKSGKPAEEAIRKIDVLVKELGQIHEEQALRDRSEGMAAQFKGTGVELLDGQLNKYIQEAAGRYMDFDIMVSAPVNGAMKKYGLKQAELHILVGDLVRNAFRAVERRGEGAGRIFFCSGFVAPDVYEIDVFDDGSEFPLEVLKNFGKRGVTTGGTGNGMADVLETLKKYDASLRLTEYRPLTNEHTKCMSIIFDGMGAVTLESYRYQLLESLGLPDYVLLIAPLDE